MLAAALGAARLSGAAAAGSDLVAPSVANTGAVEAWFSGTVLVVTVPLGQLIIAALLVLGALLLACWGCWVCGGRRASEGGAEARRLRDTADAAAEAALAGAPWGLLRDRARRAESPAPPAPREAERPARALGERPRVRIGQGPVFLTDVGVQGPVTYTGERYLHTTQGFRRGGEVTRETNPYPRPRR